MIRTLPQRCTPRRMNHPGTSRTRIRRGGAGGGEVRQHLELDELQQRDQELVRVLLLPADELRLGALHPPCVRFSSCQIAPRPLLCVFNRRIELTIQQNHPLFDEEWQGKRNTQ
jgi:hypothetical protein